MGAATVRKLRALGNSVVGVDLTDADIVADLSTETGRRVAAAGVLAACGERAEDLQGAVLAAGVGPTSGAERLITEVNYRGVVELLEAWRPALAATGNAKVVVFSSNSTTTVPAVPRRAVRALLAGEIDRALRSYRVFGRKAPAMAYAAAKIAVSRWVRRHAVLPDWAGRGIRLNALAPGPIQTPMLDRQLSTAADARLVESFPVPIGGFGDADQLADWVLFMLSDAADFLCGSVIFVDGGSDAYFRADDWPTAFPASRLLSYFRRTREFGMQNTHGGSRR